MSDTLTLPTPDQAHQTLFSRVWADAFMQKLASYGIVPANESEGQALIEMAGKIAVAEVQANEKQAQANSGQYAQALADLNTVLTGAPGATPVKVAEQQYAAKVAAAMMSDQDIYLSTLSLLNAAQS